jgi:hypothetical protein
VSTSRPESILEEALSLEVDNRRPVAKVTTLEETEEESRRKKMAFIGLAQDIDRLMDERDERERRLKGGGIAGSSLVFCVMLPVVVQAFTSFLCTLTWVVVLHRGLTDLLVFYTIPKPVTVTCLL